MGAAAASWEQTLKACLQGSGSIAMLVTLCNELQQSVRLWLDLKLVHTPVSPTVMSQAIRAVQVSLPLSITGQCVSRSLADVWPL